MNDSLEHLAHPPAGLFRRLVEVNPGEDAPEIAIFRTICDLRHLRMPPGVHHASQTRSGGAALTKDQATLRALAEGIERYSASVYRDDQFVVASAEELKGECIDLDLLPRCSTEELRNPRCPLVLPNKREKMRWVKSVSLVSHEVQFVPAIMVYSHLANVMPGERFWIPISTGCSAHFSLENAIAKGICEVVERDAISMTWLHELPLLQITFDCIPAELRPYWDLYLRSSAAVQFEFYDATMDLGVPTVYGLRIATQSEKARTLVGCSSSLNITDAISKVFCDLVSFSTAFSRTPHYPDTFAEFRDLMHGAAYMADSRRASAFDFLRKKQDRVKLSSLLDNTQVVTGLNWLVTLLQTRGMTPYVVDIATDEARSAGMSVVRVIIPQLQPLSFRYLARFLGHSRLYTATFPAGFGKLNEGQLNSLPQPFA